MSRATQIILQGDKTLAGRYVGWAKAQARALVNRVLGRPAGKSIQGTAQPYRMQRVLKLNPDVTVYINTHNQITNIRISAVATGINIAYLNVRVNFAKINRSGFFPYEETISTEGDSPRITAFADESVLLAFTGPGNFTSYRLATVRYGSSLVDVVLSGTAVESLPSSDLDITNRVSRISSTIETFGLYQGINSSGNKFVFPIVLPLVKTQIEFDSLDFDVETGTTLVTIPAGTRIRYVRINVLNPSADGSVISLSDGLGEAPADVIGLTETLIASDEPISISEDTDIHVSVSGTDGNDVSVEVDIFIEYPLSDEISESGYYVYSKHDGNWSISQFIKSTWNDDYDQNQVLSEPRLFVAMSGDGSRIITMDYPPNEEPLEVQIYQINENGTYDDYGDPVIITENTPPDFTIERIGTFSSNNSGSAFLIQWSPSVDAAETESAAVLYEEEDGGFSAIEFFTRSGTSESYPVLDGNSIIAPDTNDPPLNFRYLQLIDGALVESGLIPYPDNDTVKRSVFSKGRFYLFLNEPDGRVCRIYNPPSDNFTEIKTEGLTGSYYVPDQTVSTTT